MVYSAYGPLKLMQELPGGQSYMLIEDKFKLQTVLTTNTGSRLQ